MTGKSIDVLQTFDDMRWMVRAHMTAADGLRFSGARTRIAELLAAAAAVEAHVTAMNRADMDRLIRLRKAIAQCRSAREGGEKVG